MANLKDIKTLVALEDEGVAIPIYQKNGDPYKGADGQPSTITVVGSESKQYRAARHSQYRRMAKRVRSGRSEAAPEEMERDSLELAAAAVVAFSGWEDGTTPLAFTPENVKLLLSFDHILEQVQGGIQRHASFFDQSSTG
jgi:hypothetical protein